MIFKIKQLGILEQAEIDLSKDFILLCGHNNTGKTYLAYAIYHFLTFGPVAREHPAWSTIEGCLKPKFDLDGDLENMTRTVDLLEVWRSGCLSKEVFLTGIATQFQNTLCEFFAFPHHASFSETKLALDISEEEIEREIFSALLRMASHPKITVNYVQTPNTTTVPRPASYAINILGPRQPEKTAEIIFQTLIDCLFNFNGYLAPAERTAINIFSKELSLNKNQLFDKLLRTNYPISDWLDLLRNHVNRYPRPLRENLAIAEDLANLTKQHSEFGYLADELEHDLLQGKITVSDLGEVTYTPDNAIAQPLAVQLTGSLVKSLAGLVFYLRHLAKPRDYIVIDEPELNLHPDNQRVIARFLGRLVNAGFKVISSTHSDYIVREINNLIMLSQPTERASELRKKYGYVDSQLLKPEQVGAYLFQRTNRSPEAIPVSHTGLEIITIDEVVRELNESSQEIYFSLFD